LRFAIIHHLLCMVLWVLSLISKLIPKWKVALAIALECCEMYHFDTCIIPPPLKNLLKLKSEV
jgi:hypothetical protein